MGVCLLLSVVCCQVEVSASGVHRSPTDCGVSECDRESSTMRRPWPTGGCYAMVKKKELAYFSFQGFSNNTNRLVI